MTGIPEYPLYGESRGEYERWHQSRFDNLPSEHDIREWRRHTLKNIFTLPPLRCDVIDKLTEFSDTSICLTVVSN